MEHQHQQQEEDNKINRNKNNNKSITIKIMEKFFQTTLGMITLFILGALAIYVIIAGFSGNWNQFMAVNPTTGQVPVLDAQGRRTGNYVNSVNSSVARKVSCCNAGGGFIGNCNYPITKSDSIPACGSI